MSATPSQIGRYRIEAVLGRGAMGVIYRAHDPEIDRPVAIKLIRADLLDGTERADYLARFRHEAKAAGRCTHPNIVAIYDFAMHEGNPFLAMEYVDGVSLAQALDRGTRFTVADAAFVMLQVLDALQAAHTLGIVHRDVKPANILLIGGERVKVTDFGISRFDSSELTHSGSVIGTPSYMSPEQCRGDAVDARSDLFSAGAVLYELITGARPFAGRNFTEVSQRLLHEDPPDLRARTDAVSPALAAMVARALAKPPAARFDTAAAMAAALRAAMQEDPALAASDLSARTIIVPQPRGPAAPAAPTELTGSFDTGTLDTIERRLAQHVGPIARYLLQSAIRKAPTVEALCDALANSIELPAERDRFRADTLRRLRGTAAGRAAGASMGGGTMAASATTAGAITLPPQDLEHAQDELTRFLGPIARVLVRRAAAGAATQAELWQRLAAHIEAEGDRRTFLATRRAGSR